MESGQAANLLAWRAPGTWLRLVALAAAYYGAAQVGLLFALSNSVASPVWPPAGLAIAAVVLWGRRALPAIAVGAFFVELTAGVPAGWSLVMAAGNTAEAAIGGWLVARAGGASAFLTLGGVRRFALAPFLAALPAASMGTLGLLGAAMIAPAGAGQVWLTWFLGDVAGAMIVVPVLLLAPSLAKSRPTPRRLAQGLVAMTVAMGMVALVFGALTVSVTFLAVAPMIIIASRFGPAPTAFALLGMGTTAVIATGQGVGPFGGGSTDAAFLLLQGFLLSVTALCLALSAVAYERRSTAQILEKRILERTTSLEVEVRERRRAEADALQMASLAKASLESTGDGILVVDRAGRITGSNRRFQELWSIPSELMEAHDDQKAMGFVLSQLVEPDAFVARVQDLYQHPEEESVDLLQFKDGRVFERHSRPQRLGDEVVGRVWTFRDDTERRRNEARLDRAQQLAHLGSWQWDVAANRVDWSAELCRIFGVEPDGFHGDYATYISFVHPDDRERVDLIVKASFQMKKAFNMDHMIVRRDGTVRSIHGEGGVELGPDGSVARLTGIAQDVTETKAQEKRFRDLLESAPDAMVIVNDKGEIALVNGQAEKLFGYDRGEMVGQPLELLVPQRFHGVHPGHQKAYAHAPKQRPMGAGLELFARRKDGSEFPVEISLSPLETPEGKLVSSAIRDISGRRAAEEDRRKQEQAQQELRQLKAQADFKTNFLRTAAHELGTPMTPIRIQVNILRRLMGSPEQEKALSILDRNIGRLNVLVKDLLESARLQSGRLKLDPRPMDLAATIHEVTETFQEVAIQMGIALDTQGPHDLQMVADPNRISQVLYNLLSNAMKFTASGGHVTVRTAVRGKDVELTVTDNGLGFDAAGAARLFQPFSQLQDAMDKTHTGSGLGLYICKGIVEQHGGRIEAHSPGPGKGSTFRVVLPLVAVPMALAEEQPVERSGLGLQPARGDGDGAEPGRPGKS